MSSQKIVEISFDPAKRDITLRERGLDFVDAAKLFEGATVEFEDDRFDYGEIRMATFGLLYGEVVVVVWTDSDDGISRRIISMRRATKGETDGYFRNVG